MIECASCHTLNPGAERACLACGAALAALPVDAVGAARCPHGHPVDPSWRSCPYCDRLQTTPGDGTSQGAARATRLDEAAGPPGPPRRTRLEGEPGWPSPPPPASAPRPTRLEEPEGPPRRTVLQEHLPPPVSPGATPDVPSASLPSPGAVAGASSRPLVGVLAAPGLGPGGTVFPVRAGRNTIGAGRGNDVALPGDSEASAEHALILYRTGTFHLSDRLSTNGTWVNGDEVPASGTVVLRDRDRIRCGSTELIFLALPTAGAESN